MPDFSQGTFRVSISKPSAIVQSPTPSPMRRQNSFPSASFFVASAEWTHWMLIKPTRPTKPMHFSHFFVALNLSKRRVLYFSAQLYSHALFLYVATLSPASGKKAAVLLNLRGRGNGNFHWRSLPSSNKCSLAVPSALTSETSH